MTMPNIALRGLELSAFKLTTIDKLQRCIESCTGRVERPWEKGHIYSAKAFTGAINDKIGLLQLTEGAKTDDDQKATLTS